MFKDFSDLNDQLSLVVESETSRKIARLKQAAETAVNVASSLPTEYSRSYSQIQWMKYSSEGEPSDVTPGEQNSASNSILSRAKERATEMRAVLDENSIGSQTITIPGINEGILGLSDGIYFLLYKENGAMKIAASDSSISKPNVRNNVCYLTQLDGTYKFRQVRKTGDLYTWSDTTQNIPMHCRIFSGIVGGDYCFALVFTGSEASIPNGQIRITVLNRSDGKIYSAILTLTQGETITTPSAMTGSNQNATSFEGAIAKKFNTSSGSVPAQVNAFSVEGCTATSAVFNNNQVQSIPTSPVTSTIPAIDGETLYPGIGSLIDAVQSLI